MKAFLMIILILGLLSGWARADGQARSDQAAGGLKDEYQQGVEYYQNGEYDLAIDAFQRYLPKAPHPAPIYNLLGLTYLKQNESVESAMGSFKQAIKLDPNFAEAYFNLASAYAPRDPAMAAVYFQKTIDVDPNYFKAYFGLGWFTLTEKHDPAKAMEFFEKTIERFPDFAEAYYGKGLAYVQLGKKELALEPISYLRVMHREDLAALVELAVRGETLDALKAREEEVEKPSAEETEGGQAGQEKPPAGMQEVLIRARGKVATEGKNPGKVVKG